ncbi:hypothetical protein WR25_26173 [Diploscapter pachys]|uniref:Transthyretin/hydroxyisourate hydrolase domain-containing protein n=1 Tax=Diploscapter pachys TaxID=2018661 RepID=A0A2A2J5V0_9BILA|nr:hypothetical protein WR25_26173 [Diploscapter pachys]
MQRLLILLVVVVGYSLAIELFGRDQSSAVRGKLVCDGRPAADVKVKLWDVDRTDADDLMDSGYTDANGDFHLSGWTKEYTTIDPKLAIYHDCNDGIKPCQRKFSILLPDKYVSHGKVPQKVYDAGVIQLSGAFPGESRDCIN